MTTELLSLLLTGEVHSTYENWDADSLGIGLLRMGRKDGTNPLGTRLLRPVKPIWLCLGDLGYSTLFLDKKDFTGSTNNLESMGKALRLAHWNVWSGERSGFRVITSMHDEEPFRLGGSTQQRPPALIADDDFSESEGENEGRRRTITDSISARLHLEQKRDASLPWRGDKAATYNPDLRPISDQELDSVKSSSEDEKYYPGEYRRWRFHFGSVGGRPKDDMDAWIPFYRLHGRQRLIVEMKLAPRICCIVRSRWPAATVRDFTPAGKYPLV